MTQENAINLLDAHGVTAWSERPGFVDAFGVYTYDGRVEERIETLCCGRGPCARRVRCFTAAGMV